MENYITLENEYFETLVPEDLKEFGNDVLEYSTKKIKEYLLFFKEKSYDAKIKGAFLTTREDFVKRINSLVPGANPPEWAKGCFYGGETQVLIDKNNPYDMFHTLAHETFHLLFSKFIYEKNNWDRITWLDESLANNFDGTAEKMIQDGRFKILIEKYTDNKEIPTMEELSFQKGNIKTENYNGYDLFKIVGRYLIETKSFDELNDYLNDLEAISNDGKSILEESLKYFSTKKVNLK